MKQLHVGKRVTTKSLINLHKRLSNSASDFYLNLLEFTTQLLLFILTVDHCFRF